MRFYQGDSFERSPLWEDLAYVLRKSARLILFVFLVVVLCAYLFSQLVTERYESQTILLVDLNGDGIDMSAQAREGMGSSEDGGRELGSEVQILRSRQLVEEVVDSLGPGAFRFEPPPPETFLQAVKHYMKKTIRWAGRQGVALLVWADLRTDLTDREYAVLLMEESLSVSADSKVITARLRLPDARVCAKALDLLTQKYLETKVEVRQNSALNELIEDQVRQLERELKAIDANEERLLEEWDLNGFSDRRALLLQRLSQAETKIDANRSERVMLLEQQEEMEDRLQVLPTDLRRSEVRTKNPSRETIEQRITALKLEREQLLNRYHEDAHPVTVLNEQLAGLERLLEEEEVAHFDTVTMELNPVRHGFVERVENFKVRIAGLDAETQQLEDMARDLRRELEQLNVGGVQLENLLRTRKAAEQSYNVYAERLKDARLSNELNRLRIANITFLMPPTIPVKPVHPTRLLIVVGSLPAGLFFGIGLALLLAYLKQSIDSHRDLRNIEGVDYLGTFSLPASSTSFRDPENDRF